MDPLAEMMMPQQQPVAPVDLTAMQPQLQNLPMPGAFGGMSQPTPPLVQQMATPATTPDELENRKQGWLQVFDNPNFRRALGFMGAQLMQPVQPGQTGLGHLGQAMGTGMVAFQQGEYAQYEQKLKAAEEARKTAESGARIKASEAGTALDTARLPGVRAESDVAAGTAGDRIKAAKATREKAEQDLAKARTENEVAQVEAELKKRKAAIVKEIPDAKIREGALAEIDLAIQKVAEARARTGQAAAETKRAGTEQAVAEITLKQLQGMDDTERKEFLTKTGRYNNAASGMAQQAALWGQIYDKLPLDDVNKKGKTKEQFQMDQLTAAKATDALTGLTNYLKNTLDPDQEIVRIYTDLIKTQAGKRAGASAPKPGDTKEIPWQDAGRQMQKRTKADGTVEYRRKP